MNRKESKQQKLTHSHCTPINQHEFGGSLRISHAKTGAAASSMQVSELDHNRIINYIVSALFRQARHWPKITNLDVFN